MTRIARKLGYPEVIALLPILLFNLHYIMNLILEFLELIHVIRISLKFLKPMKSHLITKGAITLEEAKLKLENIYVAKRDSSLLFKGIAAAIIAISFLYLQDGKLVDVITALLAGGLGYLVVEILDRRLHAQFIPEFLGSLVIGIISVLGHYLLPTGDLCNNYYCLCNAYCSWVLITNAIQDHLVDTCLCLQQSP